MARRSLGVRVPRRRGEEARRRLREEGLLDTSLRPARMGEWIVFPVRGERGSLERVAGELGGSLVEGEFEEYSRPGRLEGPVKGYHVIGDIAVFSQTAGVGVEEYRRAALLLLERFPRIRSVWLKLRTEGDYRVPSLLHLAGEKRTHTVAREYGLVFHVDIARAYYNPRLAYEHRRVASMAVDGERILDMFTGVGGFALHAASLARVEVVASDLNPHAAMLAARNAEANQKRLKGAVHVFRADARLLPTILEPGYDRVILNLPAASVEFAGVACSLASRPATLHFYLLEASCDGAESRVVQALEREGCRASRVSCRRVLEYSPQEAVYAVDVGVG